MRTLGPETCERCDVDRWILALEVTTTALLEEGRAVIAFTKDGVDARFRGDVRGIEIEELLEALEPSRLEVGTSECRPPVRWDHLA